MYVEKNRSDHYRGLHVVIIHPFNGRVEEAKVFDTYAESEGFDAFVSRGIPEGRIVVAACKDDCTRKLSQAGKLWFASMGSKEIWNLEYRCGFVFIGASGQLINANERRTTKQQGEVLVTQILQLDGKIAQNLSLSKKTQLGTLEVESSEIT